MPIERTSVSLQIFEAESNKKILACENLKIHKNRLLNVGRASVLCKGRVTTQKALQTPV